MKAAFEVKSARLNVLSVQLYTDDLTAISTLLENRAGRFGELKSLPFTLDIQHLNNPASLDLGRVIAIFARYGLRVVALRHTDSQWMNLAKQHRLAFCALAEDAAPPEKPEKREPPAHQPPPPPKPAEEVKPAPPQPEPAPAVSIQALPTLVVNKPIRTGQQVYAENADLIVIGLVSEGAEIIADGNIHVYGPLRGRALAGASGNRNARIFVQSMQAELVAVAGIYRVFDQKLPAHLDKHPVQISLQDERLIVAAIQAE